MSEQELANTRGVARQRFPSPPTVVEQRFPHGHLVGDQGLDTKRDVAGQESTREGVLVEQRFPSSPTVVEQKFPHGHSVVEQGIPHVFMSSEQ